MKSNLNIQEPTIIQYQSINEILKRDNHNLVVAETGGGKTLCYALSLIECCVRIKKFLSQIHINRGYTQPLAVIMVPTRELAFQVNSVFSKLLNIPDNQELVSIDPEYVDNLKKLKIVLDLPERVLKSKEKISNVNLNSFDSNHDINKPDPIDILITMPAQLEMRARKNTFDSTYLRQFVFDEADTLMDDSFNRSTINCINRLNLNLNLPKITITQPTELSPDQPEKDENTLKQERLQTSYAILDSQIKDPSTQLLFISATIPKNIRGTLENLINCESEFKIIKTSKVNRLMLHVPQKFIRTNGTQRVELLIDLVKNELSKKEKELYLYFRIEPTRQYL